MLGGHPRALSTLFFIYCSINIVAGPFLGRAVGWLGERSTIIIENVCLICVFLGYAYTASAPTSRKSPIRPTSRRPRASPSPSTTSRRSSSRWCSASSG